MNCNQFESLITFYMDGDISENLKKSFELHLNECESCKIKFKIISSIIGDIKTAYNKIINNNYPDINNQDNYPVEIIPEGISERELSAYVDNELNDNGNIRIRRSIISKPKIRNKIEKLYKLRKIMTSSFNEQKNKLKTDYSKNVLKNINKEIMARKVCVHCFTFILTVVIALIISVWTILKII